MPRPLVSRCALRHPIVVYLSDGELDQIRAQAQSVRLSVSVFVRQVALRQKITVPPSLTHLDFSRRELAPLANNLNQIARACNAGLVTAGIYPTLTALAEQVRLLRLELSGVHADRGECDGDL